jgi:rSAM/selenodomain-associated transferase 2
MAAGMKMSIIMPVLNEAAVIGAALVSLAPLRARGHEVIVADGGSEDATRALAAPLADRVVVARRGRSRQLNAGAAAASGEALVFLHADTRLPANADCAIADALRKSNWGRFDVTIEGRSRLLPMIARLMNLRSRLTGIATGDQAIFVRRDAFPGYPEIALMEDIAFSKAMKRQAPPACLRAKASTSGRRWDEQGVLRTVLLMWRLRLAYFLGAAPDDLARRYVNKAR